MSEDLFDVVDPGEDGSATASDETASDKRGGEPAAAVSSRTDKEQVEVGGGPARVRLRVHVRPGAGRSAVVGRYGDSLHIRVAAPPVDGRANRACTELLADVLGVATGEVTLARGDKSADKSFEISGVHVEALRKRLQALVEESGSSAGRAPRKGGRR